jgi:hypothetical protein
VTFNIMYIGNRTRRGRNAEARGDDIGSIVVSLRFRFR